MIFNTVRSPRLLTAQKEFTCHSVAVISWKHEVLYSSWPSILEHVSGEFSVGIHARIETTVIRFKHSISIPTNLQSLRFTLHGLIDYFSPNNYSSLIVTLSCASSSPQVFRRNSIKINTSWKTPRHIESNTAFSLYKTAFSYLSNYFFWNYIVMHPIGIW